MKKLIAISFLVLHILNITGYSVLFNYFISRNDKQVVQQLDSDSFDEAGLIEVKVPMHLPYPAYQQDYERYNGEIELEGVHYNFVKRKIFNDTLYLFCLPNHTKTELHKAKNNFAALSGNESTSSSKKDTGSSLKKSNSTEDYFSVEHVYSYLNLSTQLTHQILLSSPLMHGYFNPAGKPPEANI